MIVVKQVKPWKIIIVTQLHTLHTYCPMLRNIYIVKPQIAT